MVLTSFLHGVRSMTNEPPSSHVNIEHLTWNERGQPTETAAIKRRRVPTERTVIAKRCYGLLYYRLIKHTVVKTWPTVHGSNGREITRRRCVG